MGYRTELNLTRSLLVDELSVRTITLLVRRPSFRAR
jgi:hypothetical protein